MERTDAESIAEFITDCSDIPESLRGSRGDVPQPRAVVPWRVDDACLNQVRELDEYV
ncbi:hypothetical protein [Herbihabitans rhizosphaerae]|uniref:hypothetical protein n=1 Tax=Herbihabitans rhizosphaerae TaxID=1872711 RepID=UPI0013EEB1D8|nr:hypothetical protein [Herbihabitans rhizosphaerae]